MRAGGTNSPAAGITGRASEGLIFARVVAGSTDIARARLADGAIQPVTRTPGREETWPYWSDAARRAVFQVSALPEAAVKRSLSPLQQNDLVLWDPETGAETKLRETPKRDERWAAWSPDGRFLVYAFRGGRPAAGIARFELATGTTQILATTTPQAAYRRPFFSPSGRRLSLEQRGDDGTGSKLRIVGLTPGSRIHIVTDETRSIDTKGFFTRSGEELLFTRRPVDGVAQKLRRRIYRISAIGGDAVPVFNFSSTEPKATESEASGSHGTAGDLNDLDEHSAKPSPTRDEFAFVSNRDNQSSRNDSDLYLAALDGSGVRRLTQTPNWSEYAPRWSPDGERIVVIASPVEKGQPRLAKVAELGEIRLRVFNRQGDLLFDEFGMMADWMPPWP